MLIDICKLCKYRTKFDTYSLAYRFHNYRIAVTVFPLNDGGMDKGAFVVCALVRFGALGPGEFRGFPCRDAIGRYVFVQLLMGHNILNVCEMEVYGRSLYRRLVFMILLEIYQYNPCYR